MLELEMPLVQMVKTLRVAMSENRYPAGMDKDTVLGIYTTLLAVCAAAGVKTTDLK